MVYDELKGISCRAATEKDIEAMYELGEPYAVNPAMHPSLREAEARTLYKEIKFGLRKMQAVVCEKDGKIVGMYTGRFDEIAQLVNEGGVFGAALLYKVVLCDLHNKFQPSYFTLNHNPLTKKTYEQIRTPSGKACEFKGKRGIVSVEAKKEIEMFFNRLKYGRK